MFSFFRSTVGVLLLLGMAGCSTYDSQVRTVRMNYAAGNYPAALAATSEEVRRAGTGGKDALVWQLENAAVLRADDRLPESDGAFEAARELYTTRREGARVLLVRGGAALLSTPANLPYNGTGYDGIMINTYQALDALRVGKPDAARVHLTRAYLLQQEIVQDNAIRIEKEKTQVEKDARLAQTISGAQPLAQSPVLESVRPELSAYADYVNPFTVYLDGLFHLTQAADASDIERARKSFERVRSFAPNCVTVSNDYVAAASAVTRVKLKPSVYVIFETGMAPSLEQVRIDIPVPIATVNYVGISFPRLRYDPTFIPSLGVRTGKDTVRTERICSMDAVITKEFNNDFPSILAKAVAAALTKAVASAAANIAARESGNDYAKIAVWAGTLAYQLSTNVADTRSWQTLPKEFQICRVDMPDDRRLALSVSGWEQPVTVIPGEVVVIYAKAVSDLRTMRISQFKLK